MYTKYLVTGGAGPLGKLIVSMLLEQGKDVRILMSELADVSEYKEKNVEISYGISTDKDTMKSFFTLDDPRSTVLIHADEYISLTDKTNLNMRRVNVAGTENIIDMCIKRKVGRVVYLGSAYALNPELQGEQMTLHFDRNKVDGEYAKTKAEAAAFVMEKITLNRLNAVLVLPTFIIGPGYAEDHDINRILKAYLKNGVNPIKDGGGHAFVDVRDVATSMIALVENGEAGSGYIVSGEYKTSNEFFQDVNTVKGINNPIKMTPKWVMRKSLSKFVDTYYKITHKENPKNVYALFQDNPQIMYANRNDILPETVISFKETIAETMGEDSSGFVEKISVSDKSEKDAEVKADEEVKTDEVPEKETEDKGEDKAGIVAAAEVLEKKDEEAQEVPEKEETSEEVKEPEESEEKSEEPEATEEPKEDAEEADDKEEKGEEPEAGDDTEEGSEDKPAEEEKSEDDVTPAEEASEEDTEDSDKEDGPETAEESEEAVEAEDKAEDAAEESEVTEDAEEQEESATEDEEEKTDESEAEAEAEEESEDKPAEEEAYEDDVTPAEEASEEDTEDSDKEDEPETAEESEETIEAEDKVEEAEESEATVEESKEETEDAEEKDDEPEAESEEETENEADEPAEEEMSEDDVTPAEEDSEDSKKEDEPETAEESEETAEAEDKPVDDSSLDDDFWSWSPTKDPTDPE